MKQEVENKINTQSYIDPGMIEAALNFWFSNSEHLRSPFPVYIREDLQNKAVLKFLEWGGQISSEAKREINDEILAEKFEEILFEIAHNMVLTEDEKLTIKYPFMPRVGDHINASTPQGQEGKSQVMDRFYHKKGDEVFLKIKLKNSTTEEVWETDFELPE
ncbi:MAG: hypothetical protein IT239_07435 [Bacteroidia bacterium]|nr:hypothetical protein [Bacteroidia bacterium]